MNTLEEGRLGLDATLNLKRHPWSAHVLHRAIIRQPFMTAKVIGPFIGKHFVCGLSAFLSFTHPARQAPPHRTKPEGIVKP